MNFKTEIRNGVVVKINDKPVRLEPHKKPISALSDVALHNENVIQDKTLYRTKQAAGEMHRDFDSLPDHRKRKARGLKRLEVWLPEALHLRYKEHCQKQGVAMSEDIARYLEGKFG